MEQAVKNTNINLAVLPMQILSDDPGIKMFCSGLVMDLITDISRFRSFQIISYKAIKNLAPGENLSEGDFQDIDLDYLVKGMVRYQNDTLTINVHLINAPQNRLVWAEKFSGKLDEIFHIQEEIVEKIIVSLQHFVDHDQLSELRKKPITNLSAYECWLKGYEQLKEGTLETDEKAREYFQKAIEIDPHYARAYTGMSLTYFNEWSCQLWSRWEISQVGAFEWAQKAVDLDKGDHVSTAILGRIHLFNGEYDKAEHYLRKALRLNPNDGENLLVIAFGLVYLGYPKEAHRLYQKAWSLNQYSEDACFACGSFVNFEMGNFEESISLGEKHQLGRGWVDFPAFMAAAYYHTGNLEKTHEYWNKFLEHFSEKINQGKPTDTQTALKWMMDVNPYSGGTKLEPFWEYISGRKFTSAVKEKSVPQSEFHNQFLPENGLWHISFANKEVKLPDLKGYYDIAKLLSSPYQSIHCTELMGAQVLEQGEEVIDDQAKKEYRERILELQQELQEAEAGYHSEQIASLQIEYDKLIDHLSSAMGKGGKTRKVSDSVEKARTAVTWRIRSAIKKLSEAHPELAKHLEVSIKTGVFCEYSPEHKMDWLV